MLAKVTAPAIAKVDGTVDSASTETDSSNPAAAYEAHVTKADGTHVTVILDKDENVLAVETGHGARGNGRGGHRGPGNGETPLTGNAAAAYEVHVTKSDGSHVTVILDKDDNVLDVETHDGSGPGHGTHH